MNVLHVSKYYYPMVGGVEQVVRTLAEGMNGPTYSTRVLAVAPRKRGLTEQINGVHVRKTPSFGELLSVPIAPLFPMEFATRSRKADLLHFHLPNPTAVTSQLTLGPDNRPLIVTYHSDIVKQKTALRMYRPLLRRFLERADRIVTTSPALLQNSEHLSPYREKCRVVPLSVDLDRFDHSTDGSHNLPIDPSRPTVLFVGRLNYYKGVEYLIDALCGIDATALIVGDGERREALETRVRERDLDTHVHFLGKIPQETLEHCYEAADLFVLPSVEPSEAFGVVQLEAMAYRTPVINTALPTGVPWVSKDGETGITVPPRDTEALAGAISRLLNDPELRDQYGENARTRVENRFSHENMLQEMKSIYDDVAASCK
jgi:glycosyltransferase involved in cell wall biosynthesis